MRNLTITRAIAFDIRTSLYQDPITFKIVVDASYDWIGYVFSISLGHIPKGDVTITSCKPFVYFLKRVWDFDCEYGFFILHGNTTMVSLNGSSNFILSCHLNTSGLFKDNSDIQGIFVIFILILFR